MNVEDLSIWELLQKKMTWIQIGNFSNKVILDFGSGNGAMASHYAENNTVIAIEPDSNVLSGTIKDQSYLQICGDISSLQQFDDCYFDVILCHNVFEYATERKEIMIQFSRILKSGGVLSILKHNRAGRVMQMAVLLNNFSSANSLLDGNNGTAVKYGPIHYYNDTDLIDWCSDFGIEKVYGQRVFWDLQQNQDIQKRADWQRDMLELEQRVSTVNEYRNIASFHHVILRKK